MPVATPLPVVTNADVFRCCQNSSWGQNLLWSNTTDLNSEHEYHLEDIISTLFLFLNLHCCFFLEDLWIKLFVKIWRSVLWRKCCLAFSFRCPVPLLDTFDATENEDMTAIPPKYCLFSSRPLQKSKYHSKASHTFFSFLVPSACKSEY